MKSNQLLRLGIFSLSCLLPLRAAEPDLRGQLRDALYTEEVTRDPEKAAQQYEALLARHDEQKAFAASALFRLAEVRRKQNRKDDAIALYQRLIAEFPNAEAETRLAKENLAALGGKMPEAEAEPALVNYEDRELAELEAKAKSSPDVLLDSGTNLSIAANQGHAKIVKRMLAAGCKPYDGGALVNAARIGNLEIVTLLTDQPDPVPETMATEAILTAIEAGRLTVLDFLLNKGLKPGKFQIGNVSMPLLAHALVQNRISGAEILLKHGADLNEMADNGSDPQFDQCGSALHFSVRNGRLDAVKWLLEKGAKPDLADPMFGLTPLHVAAKSELSESLEMMKRLLATGADPNRVSNDQAAPDSLEKTILLNATPLETAIASRSMALEKTKLLLEHKADPNRRDSRVSSMIGLAIGMGDPTVTDLVQVLGDSGFRMTDPKLMEAAIRHKNPKLIELLLKFGASPNAKDSEGNTLLAAACIAGDSERVRLLLKNGADPKEPRLLSRLIPQGPDAIPVIKLLLEAGCDPNEPSEMPPIVWVFNWDLKHAGNGNEVSAKHAKQVELIQLLLKHGADPNTTFGTFTRMPIKSGQRTMSGNRPSPFVEDSKEAKNYPASLLMKVVELEDKQDLRNVSLIKILLDAGAKPTVEFPEVFDFVAKGYESLAIAKALLPFRPKTLKLDRAGYFLNWNPQVKRLFLDEVLNPELAGNGGVFLVDEDRGGCSRLLEPNQSIPPMAELMLGNFDALRSYYSEFAGKRYEPLMNRMRRDANGQWSRESIDWRGDAALPDLASGDIIELAKGKPVPDSENNDQAFANLLAWHIRKRVSFPVTIEIGGETREIMLRGDLLSYSPTKNEAPLLSAGRLATLFLPGSPSSEMGPDSILSVRRKDGTEVRMDLSARGAGEYELMPGDHLVLPDPDRVLKEVNDWLCPVWLRIPGIPGGKTFGPLSDTRIVGKPSLTMPTLVQVLTDAYAQPFANRAWSDTKFDEAATPAISELVANGFVPVIAPHPDFSRIRILRSGDDGKEKVIEVDLVRAMKNVSGETPDAEVRRMDVPLLPGDVVELPLQGERADQPWKGFSDLEELFFRKALSGTFSIRKEDGIIESVKMVYHQPEWKETTHGLIPWVAKEGASTMRFSSFSQRSLSNCALKRDGDQLPIEISDPFLRDGDQVDASNNAPRMPVQPSPGRQPRPRVTPPPSTN